MAREVCIVLALMTVHVSPISPALLPWQLALVSFDRGPACFFVTSLMLMSATITTEKCDWSCQGLYVVCQQDDVPRVVKCIHMDKPVLALMHVWPCHVSKSEARKLREC